MSIPVCPLTEVYNDWYMHLSFPLSHRGNRHYKPHIHTQAGIHVSPRSFVHQGSPLLHTALLPRFFRWQLYQCGSLGMPHSQSLVKDAGFQTEASWWAASSFQRFKYLIVLPHGVRCLKRHPPLLDGGLPARREPLLFCSFPDSFFILDAQLLDCTVFPCGCDWVAPAWRSWSFLDVHLRVFQLIWENSSHYFFEYFSVHFPSCSPSGIPEAYTLAAQLAPMPGT